MTVKLKLSTSFTLPTTSADVGNPRLMFLEKVTEKRQRSPQACLYALWSKQVMFWDRLLNCVMLQGGKTLKFAFWMQRGNQSDWLKCCLQVEQRIFLRGLMTLLDLNQSTVWLSLKYGEICYNSSWYEGKMQRTSLIRIRLSSLLKLISRRRLFLYLHYYLP